MKKQRKITSILPICLLKMHPNFLHLKQVKILSGRRFTLSLLHSKYMVQ